MVKTENNRLIIGLIGLPEWKYVQLIIEYMHVQRRIKIYHEQAIASGSSTLCSLDSFFLMYEMLCDTIGSKMSEPVQRRVHQSDCKASSNPRWLQLLLLLAPFSPLSGNAADLHTAHTTRYVHHYIRYTSPSSLPVSSVIISYLSQSILYTRPDILITNYTLTKM